MSIRMTNVFRRIYLPLTKEEFIALQNEALKNSRHPREQARHILRSVLISDGIPNVDIQVSAAGCQEIVVGLEKACELLAKLVENTDSLYKDPKDPFER